MSERKSIRVRTTPGDSKNVVVNLQQDFNTLDILSLKISQSDIYTRACSNTGVLIGRVSANNGKGLMNARISVFIPLSDEDADDPVISELYPYTDTTMRNSDGYRYNLLSYRRAHSGHQPTGTFPDKQDVLYRDEVREIYEKYWKFTTRTNEAGDYLIYNVPVGSTTIVVDIDLSDVGCFSLRPYDLMQQGVAQKGQFENGYKFKSSTDIDSLPQIVHFEKVVDIIPFWGHQDLCQSGISRVDFDLSSLGIKIEPTALFIGSYVTDSGNLAVKVNGKAHKRQGYKCKLETYEGDVEAIRFTGKKYLDEDGNYYPELEKVVIDRMDENGTWMCSIPMNMDYVTTNEYGDEELTNDPNKGVPTAGIYRFRIGADYSDRKTEVGYYLVPNIREFTNRADGKLDETNLDTKLSYNFTDSFDEYFRVRDAQGKITHQNDTIRDLILGVNNDRIPEDYFYKFTYNKVYTVSSFHGSHFEGNHRDSFVGIKEILPNEDHDCDHAANRIPVNFGFRNRISFALIVAMVLLFFKFLMKTIHVKIVEIVGGAMYKVGEALDVWPVRKPAEKLRHAAYKWQESSQIELPLTIYPICEECGTDDIEASTQNVSASELGECMVASGVTNMLTLVGARLIFIPSQFQAQAIDPASCPNAAPIQFSDLADLHNRYLTSTPDEGGNNRYALAIFSATGDTNSAAIRVLAAGDIHFIPSGSGMEIDFVDTDALYDFLSEADSSIATGQRPLSRSYYYQIFDLDGTATDSSAIIPTYQIEQGCARYDKFYDETVMSTGKNFVWAVDDSDYGIASVRIDDQNAHVVQTTTPYGGGIYPSDVLRYTSYSDVTREVVISGLDPQATYNVQLVGSKRMTTTVDETTIFTIGGVSKNLTVKNNLTTAVVFNAVVPIVDRITITLDKTSPSTYNYLNGLVLSRNTPGIGTGIIQINLFGGFDGIQDPTWNNFDVGSGEQNEALMQNLSDTGGVPTGVDVALSYQLGLATNDVVSAFQKIYNQTDKSGIVAAAPYSVDDYTIIASVAGTSSAQPLPAEVTYKKIGRQTYTRKTKTGFTEIRNGVITVVPVIKGKSKNMDVIKEWYHRNEVSTAFCGGVVNHSFVDNWLSGILYAFKFRYRRGAGSLIDGIINGRSFQYPRELLYYDAKVDGFYYRSTPYDVHKNLFIGQRNVFGGKVMKEILRPTTIVDVGPRDEFIGEICTDKRVDPNCSVVRDITTTSYQDISEIIEYAINYRMDITGAHFKVKDFFNRDLGGVKLFDGDIVQLESINCEVGIDGFDLDGTKYFMYNDELMDPEDPAMVQYFKDTVPPPGKSSIDFGPTPIDFKLDNNGRQIRLCINHPDFLGEHSQVVPFYLWDKKGEGFGVSSQVDAQDFKRDLIVASKLQRIYSFTYPFDYVVMTQAELVNYTPQYGKTLLHVTGGSPNQPLAGEVYTGDGYSWNRTGNYTQASNYRFPDGTEEYVLYPMTKDHDFISFGVNGPDAMERFDFISTSAQDRFLYTNVPEHTLFLHVLQGTVTSPQVGDIYVWLGGQWMGPFHHYNRNGDDVFITPTVNNYVGNLQALSTPFLYYFGLRPGKTSFDRFITAFGPKGAFSNNG